MQPMTADILIAQASVHACDASSTATSSGSLCAREASPRRRQKTDVCQDSSNVQMFDVDLPLLWLLGHVPSHEEVWLIPPVRHSPESEGVGSVPDYLD